MTRFTPREYDILRVLNRYKLSISEIEEKIFSLNRPSRRTMLRLLDGLIACGYVLKTGVGKGTRYERTDKKI